MDSPRVRRSSELRQAEIVQAVIDLAAENSPADITTARIASAMNLTQGAVSRQLQVLEGQLGVALFIRDKHRLRLTQGARDYCREVRRLLTGLGQATLTLRANPGGGALNLAILPAFGMHWLAPRLAGFAQTHPEVTVNLSTRLKPFDFETSPFDAAIHYGRQDWAGVEYLPLMQEDMLAVAAPSLLPKPLERAEEVLALPLLQLESRTGDWGRWLAHHGKPGLRPPAMLFDQFATMMQGAIHGLGAALIPTYLIGRELETGRLVPLFGPAIPSTGSYYLVWPKDREDRAPLQSFRRWLKAEIG